MIESAKYISRDNHRIEYVEDGVTKYTKTDHKDYQRVLDAVTPDAYEYPDIDMVVLEEAVIGEFWRRVALHYGISEERARTHIAITGTVPVAVQNLWTKATNFMNRPAAKRAEVIDEANWTD